MTTKKWWWKNQGVLLFKGLNPWFRTEKDLKFITNEKINFETNGAPYFTTGDFVHKCILCLYFLLWSESHICISRLFADF